MQSESQATDVTLRWDYNASGAAGFVLYCGLSSRNYPTRIVVGNTDVYTIKTLPVGATSYCSVTAYDPAKVESYYSNEVQIFIPASGSTAGTTSSTVASSSSNQRPGLVAAYGFSEGAGSTTRDSSGHGHTGTIAGAAWIPTESDHALWFNGVNNWVTVNDSSLLDLTSGMTLEAWIYATSTTGVRDIVVKEGSSDIYNLYARNSRGRPEANVRVNGGNRTAEGNVLAAKVWTHVAGTYDGTTIRLYVNAIQVAAMPYTGTISTSSGPLRIGGNSLWGEFFQGGIDDVRIYNRALSPAEIAADMSNDVSP